MYFSNIKLIGFKSFADKTELEIYPGLNGIIGPNGTGKSNIIEALKWAMGEVAAKNLRASGMDDVIFNGTTSRASRNIAQVSISLDNSNNSLGGKYENEKNIEIERQIIRNSGSKYKINGKEVRAKDIQFLLADVSSGSRSSSIINQGQIGQIVNLKPTERKKLLEEASGISGIHVRKHEAEIKLNATKTNLDRIKDIIIEQNSRLNSLKKQVKQATKYKTLAYRIKKNESRLALRRWIVTNNDYDKAKEEYQNIKKNIKQLSDENGELLKKYKLEENKLLKKQEERLKIRDNNSIFQMKLDKLSFGVENINREINSKKDLLTQVTSNIERESELVEQTEKRISEINKQNKKHINTKFVDNEISNAEKEINIVRKELINITKEIEDIKFYINNIYKNNDKIIYEISSLSKRIYALREKSNALSKEKNDLTKKTDLTEEVKKSFNEKKISYRALNDLKNLFTKEKNKQEKLTKKLIEKQNIYKLSNDHITESMKKLTVLETELSLLISISPNKSHDTIEKKITIMKGYELAFLIAIGDGIDASLSQKNSIVWLKTKNKSLEKLPFGIVSLSNFVKGPQILNKFLSQVGIIETDEIGFNLQEKLLPGQILLTQKGSFWRWDGLHMSSSFETIASKRFNSKTKTINLKKNIVFINNKIEKLKNEATKHHNELKKIQEDTYVTQDNINKLSKELDLKALEYEINNNRYNKLENLSSVNLNNIDDLTAKINTINFEEKTLNTELAKLKKNPSIDIKSISVKKDKLSKLISVEEGKQLLLETKIINHAKIKQIYDSKNIRLQTLKEDLNILENQAVKGTKNKISLLKQSEIIRKEISSLENQPKKILSDINSIKNELSMTKNKLQLIEEEIIHQEEVVKRMLIKYETHNDIFVKEKEESIRKESKLEQTKNIISFEQNRIKEQLNVMPDELLKVSEIKDINELSSLNKIEEHIKRLYKERESIGGVNLQAEEELTEMTSQLDQIKSDEQDLFDSINQLKKAISELNTEARIRLKKAFDEVNTNFTLLFKKLFSGGNAYMELIESEDPLEAGLELMASPPGKKIQKLSLLSGGEQALTALALIFSVFMKKTMPICVLDEVDAPLDESNVQKFCNLISHISDSTNTRFVVVTHNRITMGHMNKLYGVTMAEPGVSKLVSVNLESADQIYDT